MSAKPYRQSMTLEEIFERSQVMPNGCIEWQQGKSKGYGLIRIGKKQTRVHRYVTLLTYGEPGANNKALHSCDNPSCVNPTHLRWGTQLENIQDMVDRQRTTIGSRNPRAVLTESDIPQVFDLLKQGKTHKQIGEIYGVTKGAIQAIASGRRWKSAKAN
jgi:hypothetical protein